ncbi:MAG: exopolysaccharide biosynthesis polyprenyl glycosylphosphotransferase [Candidatus Omnitrophica bacterium]|nr:exopolysaccharide biosynthesis polyprenyl glycosylphosphotransferase [Candidatus Omnitrophota bacterium]
MRIYQKNTQIVRIEIAKLLFAWKQYLLGGITQRFDVRRIFTSLSIGITVTFVFASIIWALKGLVYAQSEIVHNEVAFFPISKTVPFLMSGSLVSVFIGFARARYHIFKRVFDVVFSVLSLILLSPIFLILAVLIKIDSHGPVFFSQIRLGKNARLFNILKFRTMRKNAELETGPVWAREDDPRITRLGRFLRKTHLDELPQLINMLQGDMSLIGPRPERPEFVHQINQEVPRFTARLNITPGITGLAQVRYPYGDSIKDAARKLRYDVLYIKRMCWMLDFQIILWTFNRVLTGEGAR